MLKLEKMTDHETQISELFAKANKASVLVSWTKLEYSLRQVLSDFNAGRLSMLHTLKFIDGYLGAYTRRGCELNRSATW